MGISNNDLVNRFCDFVKISSERGQEKQICDKIFDDLVALGLSPQKNFVNHGYHTNGYNIYTFIKGNINADSIILNGHVDTVSPGKNIKPVVEDGYIRSSGDTILGADDKTALVTILSAIETIIKENRNHRDIELLFTVGEEAGLKGIKDFDTSILKSKISFTLDSSNPVGGMIIAAPSSTIMEIDVYGRSAHAGRAPELGISAIQVASKAIANAPLMRIDKDTTCNIGTFKSEFANNVVPDKAHISMGARSLSNKKLQKQIDEVEKCFDIACNNAEASYDFKVLKSYFAYRKTNADKSVQMAKKALTKLGIEPFGVEACGGSDAHILNEVGIDALNLACGNERVHSINEAVSVESLVNDYNLVLQLCSLL